MRHLITTTIIASAILVTVTGCTERSSMRSVPDRDGHAWTDKTKKGGLSNKPIPGDGEMFYTVVAGDTLSGIAKKFSMTTIELIDRNELKNSPVLTPKQLLVVRDPSAAVAK